MPHSTASLREGQLEGGDEIGDAESRREDNNENRPPAQVGDRPNSGTKRKMGLVQVSGTKNMKMAAPIVKSKIDKALQFELERKKVANGSRNFKGFNEDEDKEANSNVPTSLRKVIHREKVQSKDNRRQKPAPLSPTKALNEKKVVVSRGLEMRRVDVKVPSSVTVGHKSSNVVNRNKKHNDAKKESVNSEKSQTNTKLIRKTAKVDPSSTQTNNATNPKTEKKLKQRVVSKTASVNVNNNATSNHQQSLQPPSSITASSAVSSSEGHAAAINTGAGEAVPTPATAVENYRTLQEFLNMPTVKIPQKASKNLAATTSTVQDNNSKNALVLNHEHPHYYKSKFWDYVVNNKKEEPTPPEKHKNYDTSQVRQFMEKQRELRKVREIVEQRAREEQLLKKKKQLQELNEKCRTLTQKINVVKKKASKSKSGKKTPPHLDTYGFIRMEMEKIVNKITPSSQARPNKQESPSKSLSKSPSKSSEKARALAKLLSQLPNSEAVSKNTSALLQEFENIVRKECISFFQNKSVSVPLTSKGVGTTDSLAELNRTKSSTTSSSSTVISIHNTVKKTNAQDLNHAVSKIQAYWKGYKERKILKEANILPKHLVQMKRQLQFHSSSGNRGKGFVTKAPGEKPYEHFKRRLFLQEENKYVPPSPSSPKQNQEKMATKKSFNEPYPREAIQRIQEAQAEQQQSLSRRNSFSDIIKTTKKNLEFGIIGSPADTPSKTKLATTSNARRKTIGLAAQAPSISAVLYEKLRLLEKETAKSSNAADGHFPKFERDIDSISSLSSITRASEDKLDGNESQDVSITDDYFGPSVVDMKQTRTSTPINLNELNKFRSKKQENVNSSNQQRASEDSTTTVETDLELVVSAGVQPEESSSSNRREEEPTSSDGTGFSFPVPALKLQYQAEQERLRILEKALQATVEYEKTVKSKKHTTPKVKVPTKSEIQDIAKAVTEERIKLNKLEMEKEMLGQKIREQANNPESSLQLEMMKCQQEAAKATAEMSKWMLEMGKSLLEKQRNIEERDHQQQKQQQNDVLKEPVNIAAIVYAAVDEAQRIVETERRNRQQPQVDSTVYHQHCCFTNRPATITTFKDVSQQVKSATFENSSDASSESTLDKTGTSVPDLQENQNQNELSDGSINIEETEIKIPQTSENLASPKTYKTETFISEENSQEEEEEEKDETLLQEEVEMITSNNLSEVEVNIRSSELKEIEEEEPIITDNSVSLALDKTESSSIPQIVDAENESILSEIIEQIEDNEKSMINSISEANQETSEPKKELDVEIISHSPSQHENIDNDVVAIEEQGKITVDKDLRQLELEQPPFIPRESETGENETATTSEQSESEASLFLEEEKSESNKFPVNDPEKEDEIIEPPRTELNEQQIILTDDKKELAPETTQIEENIIKEEDNKKIAESLGHGNISSPPNTDKTETSIPEIIGNEGEEDDDYGSSLGEDGKLLVNYNEDNEDIRMTAKRQQDEQAESIESQLEEEEKLYSSSAVEVGSAKETPEAGKDSISETSEKYSESFVSDFEKETESEEQEHENELLFEKGDDADLLNNTLEDIKENEEIEGKEKVTIESEEDDEDDKLESLHELVQQKELVENEIKHIEIEMLQAQIASSPVDAYLSALEEQLPEGTIIKPPPPYSTSTPPQSSPQSPELLLLSAVRTFDVAFESKALKEVIENQVEQVWDCWKLTGHLPEYLPQLNITPVSSVEDDDEDVETEEDVRCYEEYLNQVKNLAMVTTALEGIEKALHIKELEGIGYVDTVRRGLFALEATKYRIPKTKSALCTAVYSLLHRSFPNIKITEDGPQPPWTRKTQKWSCRPRDVVENILVQDMIEEEPQWLQLWPESLLVIDQLASKLVQDSLQDVLHNFEIALNTD